MDNIERRRFLNPQRMRQSMTQSSLQARERFRINSKYLFFYTLNFEFSHRRVLCIIYFKGPNTSSDSESCPSLDEIPAFEGIAYCIFSL